MIGNLKKMRVELSDPVKYYLRLSDQEVYLNDLIGSEISLKHTGNIHCKKCGKKINRSFQGMCFDHFQNAPEAAECIMRPELCRGHLGEGRDPEWEKENHVQPHVVYLANSGGMKVGVTRVTQVPTRWIDQGATEAIVLAETQNRYQAGLVEVDMMQYLSDKTQWQKMLSESFTSESLKEARQEYQDYLDPALMEFLVNEEKYQAINYPLSSPPVKPNSTNFDKEKELRKVLSGIKGQYLIFEDQTVINIRRHEGYEVEFDA